ncbi:uncharacterized protein [Cicer arietinum]|uniref:Uncharacterized protein LOC101515541 n=1 Tax=Cicer arietinum TaxID=3827 RepID=A0A1S2XZN6_CICAR|nr:uncharacterized protein LOC101515541 [Cicer arietinum]
MNSSTICSLFLGLILISQSANAKGHGGGLVVTICKGATDRAACENILGSNSEISHAKSFSQLSKEVLEFAYNQAVEGQNFLKGLAQANNCPALTQCAHFDYDGAVMSFKSALAELTEDPQTANYDAKVAGDGPSQCDRGLASAQIVNPEVTALNRQILLLSEFAFLATSQLSSN